MFSADDFALRCITASTTVATDANFVHCLGKVLEIQEDVERKVSQLISLRDGINRRIDTIADPEEQLLLYRYFDNCAWEEIETLMNVSERTVYRIHDSALQHFPVPEKS